ncbi:tRNA(Ile)-lysidine synthase [Gammaproteobacteria bacterium]
MNFSPTALRVALVGVPSARRWWVAYSGGLDSHCLLHALAGLASELPALSVVHVDHGLNSASGDWAQHCASICTQLQVPYRLLRVRIQPEAGKSLEALARTARYGALAQVMEPGEVLLTAHHQDDQVETMLLQLLRGAGPRGLAAMPALAPFHSGYLARPLLEYSRDALLIYARTVGLLWVEDDSNLDLRYDRNYLRHQVLPLLLQRWPAATATLTRATAHQADATYLLESLAKQDLPAVVGVRSDTLQVGALSALDPIRARNLLRYWIRGNGHEIPSAARLEQVLRGVVGARWDATPRLAWVGTELRRYRDLLYLMTPLPPLPAPDWEVKWQDLVVPLCLPWGTLTAQPMIGEGLAGSACIQGLTVRLRQGGERCRLVGSGHHRPLKDLWQAAGVPPWERVRTPLLFLGGELVSVPGIGLNHRFQAQPGDMGWKIVWQGRGAAILSHPID